MNTLPRRAPKGKPHYTYVLRYPHNYVDMQLAGTVFYVGKGSRERIHDHERYALRGKKSHNCNVIRKIWANGYEIEKKKLAFFPTHQEACMYEIALIFFLPNLTNKTRGGDGIVGLERTEEHRRKLGEAQRVSPRAIEAHRKLGEARKGCTIAETTRRAISESNKNRVVSEVTRQRMSEAQKDKVISEEHRQALREFHTDLPQSEETKQKLREINTGKELSEEHRQNIGNGIRSSASYQASREKMRGSTASEATRKRMSESQKLAWERRRQALNEE